jgi:hypothetical protein
MRTVGVECLPDLLLQQQPMAVTDRGAAQVFDQWHGAAELIHFVLHGARQ